MASRIAIDYSYPGGW
ncbi:hypothetical protein RB213_015186 [Colletotrichum asianum]